MSILLKPPCCNGTARDKSVDNHLVQIVGHSEECIKKIAKQRQVNVQLSTLLEQFNQAASKTGKAAADLLALANAFEMTLIGGAYVRVVGSDAIVVLTEQTDYNTYGTSSMTTLKEIINTIKWRKAIRNATGHIVIAGIATDGLSLEALHCKSLNLSNLDTSSMTNAAYLFNMSNITNLDMTNVDFSNVKITEGMFYGFITNELYVSDLKLNAVEDAKVMFAFSKIGTLDLTDFADKTIIISEDMFDSCKASKIICNSTIIENALEVDGINYIRA